MRSGDRQDSRESTQILLGEKDILCIVAKKRSARGTRRMGRYIRGTVNESIAGGTLAAKTLLSADFDEAVNERTLVSSIVARYVLSNFTIGAGIGPILVGIAHSDYTDTELESWIESTGTWDEGNLQQQEVASRKIRRIGVFSPNTAVVGDVTVLKDGVAIKTKLNWILLQGQTLNLWIYNLGTAAFATTDPVIQAEGHVNLWPR